MSDATSPETWPVLTLVQRRLLGVLVEKAKTTPDAYPLSLNALTTGSNQKSNRDPVLDLNDDDVEEGLVSLQPMGLATRITGGRVERWRHNLYEVWHIDKVELAILAELLLRGPQTEGELRTRAARMEPINDLDLLRAKLKPLQQRRLIVWLGEEGRRGAQLTHGFHDRAELEALRKRAAAGESAAAASVVESRPAAPAVSPSELVAMKQEMSGLKDEVQRLQATVRNLAEELGALKRSLGA